MRSLGKSWKKIPSQGVPVCGCIWVRLHPTTYSRATRVRDSLRPMWLACWEPLIGQIISAMMWKTEGESLPELRLLFSVITGQVSGTVMPSNQSDCTATIGQRHLHWNIKIILKKSPDPVSTHLQWQKCCFVKFKVVNNLKRCISDFFRQARPSSSQWYTQKGHYSLNPQIPGCFVASD